MLRTRPGVGDLVAGVSVALVLVPQALANSELAGLPAQMGLFAAALPPVAAAFFVSSPYLQTGPVALTALLTFGALEGVRNGGGDLVATAALLALVVGVTRVLLGVLRLGVVAYLMSEPVLMGFTTGAAVLIAASQFPTAVAAPAPDGGVVDRAWWALVHPGDWGGQATILAVVTVALVVGARRVHRLFPGVLVAVLVGLVWSEVADYPDAIIGDLPSGLPTLSLALPWSDIGMVLVPGIVIALVGFAEPAAIARTYAAADRQPWSADREFIASGVANLTSGISGGFPVGGSFARSSINRLAGARTRWSGGITGALVFAFLPFASVLEPLPRAVLGAIVVAAAASLIRIPTLVRLWAESLPQATVAWTTMVVTLVASPHVEWGVVSGIALAVGVHLWRELRIVVEGEIEGNRCMLRPRGVLWFGSANRIDDLLLDVAARHPEVDEVVVDLSGLGRVDYSGAMVLRRMLDEAEESGLTVEVRGLPPQSSRVVARYLRGRAVRRPGAGAPDRRPPTSRPRSGSDRPE